MSASPRRLGRDCSTTASDSSWSPSSSREGGYIEQRFVVDVGHGDELIIEKIAALFTSRDMAISEPLSAGAGVGRQRGRRASTNCWTATPWPGATCGAGAPSAWAPTTIWPSSSTCTPSTFCRPCRRTPVGLDVGIPARGLHGEAYRGHVFWDELFVFPFLTLRFPELARSLLLYRYRRLDQARRAATAAGYAGAMFPWQSGSDGREETQTMHLNPLSGRWRPDPIPAATSRQRRHRGQHLAVLPGHRRHPVPALLRRRDDPRDRPLLGERVRPTTTPSTATRSRA